MPDVTSFLQDNISGLKNRLYSGFDGYMVRWRFPNLIQGSKKILEANLENRRWPSLGQNNEKCLLQHNMCFFNMPVSAQYVLFQHNMCFFKYRPRPIRCLYVTLAGFENKIWKTFIVNPENYMCPNYGENVQYINTYPVNFTVRKCPCLFGAFKAP